MGQAAISEPCISPAKSKLKELDILKQQEEKLQSLDDEKFKTTPRFTTTEAEALSARSSAKVSTWLAPEYIVIIQNVFDKVAAPGG